MTDNPFDEPDDYDGHLVYRGVMIGLGVTFVAVAWVYMGYVFLTMIVERLP
jgi:hypothetical protein